MAGLSALMGASAMFPGVGVGSMPHLASATLLGASGGVGAVGVAQPGLVIIVSNLNKTECMVTCQESRLCIIKGIQR